ncbi:MAG: hypothetical protein C5B53_02700 [Candidatus Melainabacteria bacterium]|nr:MAG: hypothetical protein C5B53_02700 [Candidatus Melainabacteria bacterium]
MPTANIYTANGTSKELLTGILPELGEFLARQLSCGQRTLLSNEISIRVISITGSNMIAPIEIEITAHAYQERIQQADKICLSVRNFVKQKTSAREDVRVWLTLAELGHSWEE